MKKLILSQRPLQVRMICSHESALWASGKAMRNKLNMNQKCQQNQKTLDVHNRGWLNSEWTRCY